MNKKIINKGWQFTKEKIEVKAGVLAKGKWQNLDLPYTWNGKDGQDGGNDYYRGTCYFAKTIKKEELPEGEEFYLQFEGTNSSAEVFVNGKSVASHDGGYSTWRVNLTEFASADMELVVAVDNSPNDRVYPQNADFTFYGGIYRDVTLIGVPKAHFDLDYYGCQGIMVTPEVKGSDAQVKIEVWPVNVPDSAALEFVIKDGDTVVESATVSAKDTAWETVIKDVHLWDGRKDPHLYTACVALKDGDRVLDERCVRFGCRSFVIDPEKGFILNGKEYPLRGVSRHQDRPDIGNALSHADHEDDLRLIMEMGATTIRLAHYQHDQYFYDLCDEAGMVLWAEIPYISNHMPGGRENTISQMKELVYQNYNHPSIVVWGLSNEITMSGADDPDLIENHHILNDLCHELDKTRPTTMAVVSMCEMDEEYVRIPDTRSYNHYFGWYGGDTSMNGPWFDEYHAKYPKEPVGISEYGCEALNWHTSNPMQGDYTEEYQAFYHEELIKQIAERPYLWATHVWNMFDFAADARAEGGEDGMNHKGLVTFDRKYKKDSYYAYKAWLNPEPMVHICGKRYVDRVEDTTKVTVYSNCDVVELFANGELVARKAKEKYPFFYFDVPNVGTTKITVKAGDLTDESTINKVAEPNPDYILPQVVGGEVLNWFDITEPEGYFNINCTIKEIMATEEGKKLFGKIMDEMMSGGKAGGVNIDISKSKGIMKMFQGFTVKRVLSMAGTMGAEPMKKADIIRLNQELNKIKRK